MRKLAVLLALTGPVLAQDDAASLFYKGFWLEQAEGKLDEASALYGKLLSEKPDAPEAPRALLGLVRIKVAKNEDATLLLAELRRYGAKDEIAEAERLTAVRGRAFDPDPQKNDTAVGRKLVSLFEKKLRGLSDPDQRFLIDLGSAAHPMLATLLRDQEADAVEAAANILVYQNTPEAHALLARALLDDDALFRSQMLVRLGECGAQTVLVDALGQLYDRSPPRLRCQVVETLHSMACERGDGVGGAVAILTRALGDKDPETRAAAAGAIDLESSVLPDAFVDALLGYAGAGELKGDLYGLLLKFAGKAAFRDRIEKTLVSRTMDRRLLDVRDDEGALLLARVVSVRLRKGSREDYDHALVLKAAYWPKAAAALLSLALELESKEIPLWVKGGIGQRDPATFLGDDAVGVRVAALAAAAETDPTRDVAVGAVLGIVGLGQGDFPAIVEAMRRRGGKGLPAFLLDAERLFQLGPEKAGALVQFCKEGQADLLLKAGVSFRTRDDRGVAFFRQVVPSAGPSSVLMLAKLTEFPALVPLLAERLLGADGPEWGWTIEPRARQYGDPRVLALGGGGPDPGERPGPYLWELLRQLEGDPVTAPPLRGQLIARVEDSRPAIAVAAAAAAAADGTDAGTEALKRALRSKWPDARGAALKALAARVPDATALVREFARRTDLTARDREWVGSVIGAVKGPAMAQLAADLIGEDLAWDRLWSTLDPKLAVENALAARPSLGSLWVLVEADDRRRIEVFRAVLKGTDRSLIQVVLNAVREQYLVELGEETLAQLRSPDANVRSCAMAAIERLKFYAEARKAFEK